MKTTQLTAKFIVFLASFCFIFAAATANAAPGDLDTTFNGTGKLRAAVGGGDDEACDAARQTDGKLVVVGSSFNVTSGDFMVVRYNSNGSFDTTFGIGGKVRTSISTNSTAKAVAILSGNKIIVAGESRNGSNYDFTVVKYNSDGTLDTSFGGGDGIVTTDFGSSSDKVNDLAIQSDGKIVVVGSTYANNAEIFAVARYNADGTLDTTFDSDGKVVTSVPYNGLDTTETASAVAFYGSKILVAGNTRVDYHNGFYPSMATIIRYNANGSLDTSFDGDGYVISGFYNTQGYGATSIAFTATTVGTERIVVSTSDEGYLVLLGFHADNGSRDNTFGNAGVAETNLADSGKAVQVQFANGLSNKIYAAGEKNNNFALVRYNLDGTLDTAFGNGGIITTNLSNGSAYCHAMLIQPSDNKIVVAGTTETIVVAGTGQVAQSDFAIVRYNSNGTLDTTFDGDGKRIDDIGNAVASARRVAIQPDGKIIAAGYLTIARFNPDGSFDTTFGVGGKINYATSPFSGMALQSDGKIVVVGSEFAARYKADGSLDTAFGTGGIVISTIFANSVAIQPDGAIVVAGYTGGSNSDFAVYRLLSNGTLDSSFDIDGKVTTAIGAGNDFANAVIVQPDYKIVAAGSVANGTNNTDFALVRYNPDGSLDTTFSFDGKQTTAISTNNDNAYSLAIQTDYKIIAAGYGYSGTNNDFAAARYNPDGSLDTTFGTGGKILTAVGTLNDVGNAIVIQSDGKILIAGSTETTANINDFAVVRYNSNGSLDNLFAAGGKKAIDFSGGSDIGNAITLDSSDRIIIAGQADKLFGIVRLLSDAPLSQTYEGDVQSRPIGDGFVDSDDIQQIRRFSIGNNLPYQSNEFQRADCAPRSMSGDGFVDGDDVQQARRYSIGTDGNQIAGGPTSAPPPVELDLLDEITRLPFGKQFIRTKNGVQAAPAAFRIDAQNTSAGSILTVPIRVDTVGNEAGYTFSIAFDSTVLTNPNVVIGDSGGDVLFNANNPGQIGFSVTTFSGGTIAEGSNKTLVTVTFTVAAVAQPGTVPITFTDTPARRKASPVDPNFPITQPTYTGGTITIGGATAAGTTLSGRIITAGGRGLSNATVILTDASGSQRLVRTGTFGYYRFENVEAGQTYIVGVQSKRYKYDSQTVSITDDFNVLNFYAVP